MVPSQTSRDKTMGHPPEKPMPIVTGQLSVQIEEWVVLLTLAIRTALPHLEALEALQGKVVQILLLGPEAGQEQA